MVCITIRFSFMVISSDQLYFYIFSLWRKSNKSFLLLYNPTVKQTKLRAGCKSASSQERWQVAELKHLKTSYVFSLPRICAKDFPYIKEKIDWSIGINYSSVDFKWTQVFLCCQSFDRRGQWIFLKYGSYRISLNQRVSLWYGWELRWIELGFVRRPTSQEMK